MCKPVEAGGQRQAGFLITSTFSFFSFSSQKTRSRYIPQVGSHAASAGTAGVWPQPLL